MSFKGVSLTSYHSASCHNFCNFASVAEDVLEPQIPQYLLPWCWDCKYAHTITDSYEVTGKLLTNGYILECKEYT